MNIHLQVIQCLHIVHLMLQKNKLDGYRGKDCMKRFCKDLKEHATKIISYEKKKKRKKEMMPLSNKERKLHRKQIVCYICKKRFSTD